MNHKDPKKSLSQGNDKSSYKQPNSTAPGRAINSTREVRNSEGVIIPPMPAHVPLK